MNRLRRLSWVVLVAALVGAMALIAITFAEQRAAARQRRAALAAEHFVRRLSEVDAAEWRAIARPGSPGTAQGILVALRQAQVARQAVTFGQAAAARHHAEVFGVYASALRQEVALLTAGRVRAAKALDDARVEQGYLATRAGADETSAGERRHADAATSAAQRLTVATALLSMLVLVLLGVQLVAQQRLLTRERRHLDELQGLDRLKDMFVASVSHELRTPLTSIRGYLELVLEGEAGELNSEQDELLRVVERNADRLLSLVGDLLFVAQIDAGKLDLDTGACDLAELAAASAQTMRPLAEAKNIELVLEAAGPIRLVADPGRVGQLIDNLLSNAVKFTPDGGRVGISASCHGGQATLEVSDSGIGIPQSELERLFDRFFRASTATEQEIQGTGLGLSISKAIVDAHGGEISVESAEGVGTTFRVTLPLGSVVPSPDGFDTGSRTRARSRSAHRARASVAGSRRTA